MRRGSKGSPPPGSGRLLRTPSFSGRILPPKKTKVRVGPGSRGSQRFADCALSLSPMPRRKVGVFRFGQRGSDAAEHPEIGTDSLKAG